MNDGDIEQTLRQAAHGSPAPDPALLARIGARLEADLQPVRPLRSGALLQAALLLACAALAVGAGARAGLDGFAALPALARVVIFAALAALAWLSARQLVAECVPGSRRSLQAGSLFAFVMLSLLGVFALLFRDYHTEHFFVAGATCLVTGVLHALPAGLLAWLVLRRGFAVQPVAAGLIGGVLCGLTGLTVLELHCGNFQALHVLVWHGAVVLVCGALGALIALVLGAARNRRTQEST